MKEYYVPAGRGESEYVEKRSSFLGYVMPVKTEDEAREFIEEIKKEHYGARHNCWCYSIKDGPERYSDDGEPQGTAGIPMLEVFRREGITDFVCVVTRYFGGVLLGTGGLLRAYTKAAKDALEEAGIAEVRSWTECALPCEYAHFERYKKAAADVSAIITDTVYAERITLQLMLPSEYIEDFANEISDICLGTPNLTILGEKFSAVPLHPSEA